MKNKHIHVSEILILDRNTKKIACFFEFLSVYTGII